MSTLLATARTQPLSAYTMELLGPHAHRNEQLWMAAFAGYAARVIGQRGAHPATRCLDRATCDQPPPLQSYRQTPDLGPICVLCALDAAFDRHAPEVTTPQAEATRTLYRAAKIAVAEIILSNLTVDTNDTDLIVRALRDLGTEIRAVNPPTPVDTGAHPTYHYQSPQQSPQQHHTPHDTPEGQP